MLLDCSLLLNHLLAFLVHLVILVSPQMGLNLCAPVVLSTLEVLIRAQHALEVNIPRLVAVSALPVRLGNTRHQP